MTEIICSSCKRRITIGSARFLCPKCGRTEIIRCNHCRKSAVKYECPSCHFTGPN